MKDFSGPKIESSAVLIHGLRLRTNRPQDGSPLLSRKAWTYAEGVSTRKYPRHLLTLETKKELPRRPRCGNLPSMTIGSTTGSAGATLVPIRGDEFPDCLRIFRSFRPTSASRRSFGSSTANHVSSFCHRPADYCLGSSEPPGHLRPAHFCLPI